MDNYNKMENKIALDNRSINTSQEAQSIEELSSFDISDDDNPLREQLKKIHISNLNNETIDNSTESSRKTSVNNGPLNNANIMGTPGSIFSVKTNTTRPSSRSTIAPGYGSDKIEQRLVHGKAILIDMQLGQSEAEYNTEDDIKEQDSVREAEKAEELKEAEGTEEAEEGQIPKNQNLENELADEIEQPPLDKLSPRRLHRVMNYNHSETDLSYSSDTNINFQDSNLTKILNSEDIYDNTGDRISTGAEITRLNKELINCKVQIQLQQEIIRNNLLSRSGDQKPANYELMEKLNSLSKGDGHKINDLQEKYQLLHKDMTELQNMNSILIEQQEQKQSDYEQWCEISADILSFLEGITYDIDPNQSDSESDKLKNNLGTILQVVSNKVRTIVNRLKELENHLRVQNLEGGDQSAIISTPTDVDTKGNFNITSSQENLLTHNSGVDNSSKDNEIDLLKQQVSKMKVELSKQKSLVVSFKNGINKSVSLLQRTLIDYINEFIGFHSDFISVISKVFAQESINETLNVLKQLVMICDNYQRNGTLINFPNVRSLMNPVWQHNSTAIYILVSKYDDFMKEKEQKRTKSHNNITSDTIKINKLNDEISSLRSQVNHLEDQLKIANGNKIKAKNIDDSTYKLRLERMTRKWKESEEALIFEKRANHLKIKELEQEISSLKIKS